MMHRKTAPIGRVALVAFLVGSTAPLAAQTTVGADQAIKEVFTGLADGKPIVVWQALPASYQKDVKSLITDAAGKFDPEVYDKAFAVARKSVKLLKDKKEFILKSEFAKNTPPAIDKNKMGDGYDAVVDLVDTLVGSDLGKLDELKKADVEKFLSGTGAKILNQFSALDKFVDKTKFKPGTSSVTEIPAKLRKAKVTVVKAGATETTLQIEDPDATVPVKEESWVKVEGKWVPKELADGWADGIKDAKKQLAAAPPFLTKEGKKQALDALNLADQAIDKLANTKTREEFEKALKDLVAAFQK
jgi:hypothetical protein